jgi:hypothetical protein
LLKGCLSQKQELADHADVEFDESEYYLSLVTKEQRMEAVEMFGGLKNVKNIVLQRRSKARVRCDSTISFAKEHLDMDGIWKIGRKPDGSIRWFEAGNSLQSHVRREKQ